MVLSFFCRSFFRPAGRKNDLQRVRNPLYLLTRSSAAVACAENGPFGPAMVR